MWIKKHCDTCLYAYMECEHFQLRQKCRSMEYNSTKFTHDMLMENWGRSYCRFWAPNTKNGQRHEK